MDAVRGVRDKYEVWSSLHLAFHVLHPLLHQQESILCVNVKCTHNTYMWQLSSIAFPKSSTLASLLTLIAVPRIQYLAPKCSFCNLLLAQITEGWKLASMVSVVIIAPVRWGHPIPSTWILSTLCKYSQLYIILKMVIAQCKCNSAKFADQKRPYAAHRREVRFANSQ